jgi:flagellar P-ring protein precursor FlgI
MIRRAALLLVLALAAVARPAAAQRVGDLVRRPGDVPRRIVGYGLVVGLDGTGDRSFGGTAGGAHTVRSVVNLLRRMNVEVPPERLRLRTVAAVLVTAEISPWLRSGGRFEVQVSALGDATSLRGGVLWMTPLVTDPREAPVATAQGPLLVGEPLDRMVTWARSGNAARIPEGGLLEVDPVALPATEPRLHLRTPDLGAAQRIVAAINAARGAGTAAVQDPGSITLTVPADSAGPAAFLAAIDTLPVAAGRQTRVVIDARRGTVVAGGDVTVAEAAVSHRGMALEISNDVDPAADSTGTVRAATGATVVDIVNGLRAAGAQPGEVAAILEALAAAGALRADVVIR